MRHLWMCKLILDTSYLCKDFTWNSRSLKLDLTPKSTFFGAASWEWKREMCIRTTQGLNTITPHWMNDHDISEIIERIAMTIYWHLPFIEEIVLGNSVVFVVLTLIKGVVVLLSRVKCIQPFPLLPYCRPVQLLWDIFHYNDLDGARTTVGLSM